MALYEYRCAKCGSDFDKLVSIRKTAIKVNCPACGSARVKRKLSTFSTVGASSGQVSSASSCDTGGG